MIAHFMVSVSTFHYPKTMFLHHCYVVKPPFNKNRKPYTGHVAK